MKTKKTTPKKSIYRNQDPLIRAAFEKAGSPRKILCVALDFAKSKHVALFCDGNGDILKASFPVENNAAGVIYLRDQIASTSRKRKIEKSCVIIGGEDEPAYVCNFLAALREHGYTTSRVSAREAKTNRENLLASTDDLDLLGIAKTLLARRARSVDPGADGSGIYSEIRELTRARRSLVRSQTAASNRAHALADLLFPGFLNASKSGVTPFCEASLALMADRFSAPPVRPPQTARPRKHTAQTRHPRRPWLRWETSHTCLGSPRSTARTHPRRTENSHPHRRPLRLPREKQQKPAR